MCETFLFLARIERYTCIVINVYWFSCRTPCIIFHIRTVHLDIIKVLFIHQLMHQ